MGNDHNYARPNPPSPLDHNYARPSTPRLVDHDYARPSTPTASETHSDPSQDNLIGHEIEIQASEQNDSETNDQPAQIVDNQIDTEWLNGYTEQELSDMQKEDPNIGIIVEKLIAGENKPTWEQISPYNSAIKALWANWDRLKVQNGVLYRKFERENELDTVWQLVLPKRLVNIVLAALHDGPQACHLGEAKTLGAIQKRVYFYGYKQTVIAWLRKCHICNSKKPSPNLKRAPLINYVTGAPLEKVHLDIAGPFPPSKGNKYILVIGDHFTKFMIAAPMPDMKAERVADILVNEWILKYGTPRIIHSDRGTQFTSNIFKDLCKLLGVHQTLNSAYHPRGNGLIEKQNSTIERMLAMTVKENQSDWAIKLPYVMSAYRATPHRSTGLSPNQMMFGREVEMPIDLVIGRPKDTAPITYGDFNEAQICHFVEAYAIAHKNLERAAINQKRYYDVKVKDNKLTAGTRVWCYFPHSKVRRSPKLGRQWQGPFTIMERIGDVNYKIRLNPRRKPKIVHRDRLNVYRGPMRFRIRPYNEQPVQAR